MLVFIASSVHFSWKLQ